MFGLFGSVLPSSRDERWRTVAQILDRWFPPRRLGALVSTDAIRAAEARLGLGLPKALHEWFGLFGDRREVWSLQDTMRGPGQIQVEDGVLVLCVENQGVVRWGIKIEDLENDDPPVLVSDPLDGERNRQRWLMEADRLTTFFLQQALLNVKFSDAAPYSGNAGASDSLFAAVAAHYPRAPFDDLHWPPWPTRFHGDSVTHIELQSNTWIWVAAKSQAAFEAFEQLAQRADPGWAWEHTISPT